MAGRPHTRLQATGAYKRAAETPKRTPKRRRAAAAREELDNGAVMLQFQVDMADGASQALSVEGLDTD